MERLKRRRHILNIGSLLHQSLGAKYLSLFVPDFFLLFFVCVRLLSCVFAQKRRNQLFPPPPLQIPARILIDIFSEKDPLINISCVHIYKKKVSPFFAVYQLQVDGLSCIFTTRSRAYSVSFPVILYIAYIYIYAYSEKSMLVFFFLIIMDDVPCFSPFKQWLLLYCSILLML